MEDRYSRNIGVLSQEQQRILNEKKVLVAGCGGLGGYIIENLVRAGVKKFTVCDADTFDQTNLNRQLNALNGTMGMEKAQAAKDRILSIDPSASVEAVCQKIDSGNVDSLIQGCDLVLDAFDNVESRLVLERACEKAGKTYIYGGVNGWFGSVCTVRPGDRTVEKLYKGAPAPRKPSVICMAVSAVAAFQAAEAVKVMLGEGQLMGKMLMVDLRYNNFEIIDLR